MAKSLRSKWKRKMRAVKRERYGEKELKRLNEMLAAAGDIQFLPEIKEEKSEGENTEKMSVDPPEIIQGKAAIRFLRSSGKISKPHSSTTLSSALTLRRSRIDRGLKKKPKKFPTESEEIKVPDGDEDNDGEGSPEKMAIDRVFNKRTMRDQFGNYPDWMNKRKIRTQQNKTKRIKKRRAQSLKRK